MKTTACRLCGKAEVSVLRDFGPQPLCNRYLTAQDESEYAHPLRLGQCGACGLVQLDQFPPSGQVLSRFNWITYREPEGHLDVLADVLGRLPGITTKSVFCGTTFKDDSLLDRMEKKGFNRRWRVDPQKDLGVENPRAGLETIQEKLDCDAARKIAGARGRADVVIARHILEHAHDPRRFMDAVKELAAPGGYVVFEAPACERVMEKNDFGGVWEEHILYFTAETFKRAFTAAGLSLAEFITYPYFLEDSLVGVARLKAEPAKPVSAEILGREISRARAYARGLDKTRLEFQGLLGESAHRGQAALFGAGHRSATFINLLGLKDLIGFVVDDDPNKRGLLMPGSRLPILESSALCEKGVKLCLLNLSCESEAKVVKNNAPFLEQGGKFVSIFPDSPYALKTV